MSNTLTASMDPNSGSMNEARIRQLVCFQQNTRDEVRLMNGDGDLAGCLPASPGMKQQNYIAGSSTPLDYRRQRWFTKYLPQGLDSARYRACGNAVTVNVLYWLGLRIMCVDRMFAELEAEEQA